jgi:hypothetical protein
MKIAAYLVCVVLVAISNGYVWTVWLMAYLSMPLQYSTIFSLVSSFDWLIPQMLGISVPGSVALVLRGTMSILLLRRIWLAFAKRELVPPTFSGFQKVLGYIGFLSFLGSIVVFLFSLALKAGSGVPAGLLLIPAMFCIPWAFFLTEILSLKKRAVSQ